MVRNTKYMHHFFPILGIVVILCSSLALNTVQGQDTAVSMLYEKELSQYVHDSWQSRQGLPQSSINTILQSRDGYIWLGTQEGLVRFDGINFKVFDKSIVDIMLSNDVRVLHEDLKGQLWIGMRDGGLLHLESDSFSVIKGFENNRISALASSSDGELWIGTTDNGLHQLIGDSLSKWDNLPSEQIGALLYESGGTLWVGTRDSGLVAIKENMPRHWTTADGLPSNDITALSGGEKTGLWLGTREAGLAFFHHGVFRTYTQDENLPSNLILTLFEDRRGNLWIGTDQGGLARWNNPGSNNTRSSFSHFKSSDGLTHDTVKSLYEDSEGILWIGTDGGGLNSLRSGKFTTYTSQEGLVEDFIYSVHQDNQGDFWFSSENGVSRYREGEFNSFTVNDGLTNNFVTSFASTPDGSVWMGTYGGGLNRLSYDKNGKALFTSFTTQNGLLDDGVFALYTDSNGRLWIGTGGGLSYYENGTFSHYTEEDGLSSNFITIILETANQSIWVGTYDAGLNIIQDGNISSLTTEDGLTSSAILALHEDNDGGLWIGSYGGGLNRLKDGILTSFTTRDGLFNDNVFKILQDDQENLWMSCNKGLFMVSKKNLTDYAEGLIDRIESTVFDVSDGLKSQEFNGGIQPAGWQSTDGRLWFPSAKGVAVIDPNRIETNELPPNLVLESVIADEQTLSIADHTVLKPGTEKIEFHYVGLNFTAPDQVKYRYKLDGVDDDWVEAGSRNAAYYTNLQPGDYIFSIMAQNNDGVWNKYPVTFSFYLQPFWYQNKWVLALGLIITLLTTFMVHRARVAQLKNRKLHLERVVDTRTRHLRSALQENEEILGITAHDLKNPLGGIIGLSDIVLEDLIELANPDANAIALENVQLVKQEAERMLRIVQDLLDDHRKGNVKDQLRRELADLSEIAQSAIRLNNQQAFKKHIVIEFERIDAIPVFIDVDAMLRVVDNLVSNAVKYSPSGSMVWVETEKEKDHAIIRVKDQGPGLNETDKLRVFGKLQRLSAKPTAGESSTGLGLYIVKQLIEDHGGTVGVDSEYGNGACFWVRLPLEESVVERKEPALVD